jgi:hypothetical protein
VYVRIKKIKLTKNLRVCWTKEAMLLGWATLALLLSGLVLLQKESNKCYFSAPAWNLSRNSYAFGIVSDLVCVITSSHP